MIHVHIRERQLADQVDLIRPLIDRDVAISTGPAIPEKTELLITEHCPEDQLDQLRSLKWILFPCAGVPMPMRPILEARPHISAHNLHYNDISVAETAIALLLAASKRIIPLDHKLRQGSWTPSTVDTRHAILSGSKCLLLGFGAIGRRIAPILDAFGVEVTVVKRTPADDLPYSCLTGDEWKSVLPETDILISVLPATPETHRIIDRSVFDALPDHAVFINVGRGTNVDEQALYEALKNKTIGAAGIDVWWNYPPSYPYMPDDDATPCLPSEYPFQELDNVVMTPHRGADCRMEQLQQRLRSMLAERINQAAQGVDLPDKISPAHGY